MKTKLTARRVTFRATASQPGLPAYDMALTVLSKDKDDAARLARKMMRDTFASIDIRDISRA